LNYGDSFVEDVVDIGAGLGVTPLVKVEDRVVVGVGDIVFYLVMLDSAVGVFFIVTF